MAVQIATAGRPELADLRAGWLLTDYPDVPTETYDRLDFIHFWFYSALVAPWVWVVEALHLSLNYAFTIVNLALLLLACWVASSRMTASSAALVLAGPIFWWIDKAHTEVFTFSLLSMAFLLFRDAPWWSLVCLGAAATQNPPIAALVPLFALAAVFSKRELLRARRLWIGSVAALMLAILHPVYSIVRFGMLSRLLAQSSQQLSSLESLGVVVWDPNLGLIAGDPPLVAAMATLVVLLLLKASRSFLRAEVILSMAAAALFLASFAQTVNFNHGGTPGMSRYALWLIPLAIPLLQQIELHGTAFSRRFVPSAATISCVWCLFAFHPGLPEEYGKPSWLGSYLWTRWPSLNNPLPEVFAERLGGGDLSWLPVATAGCEKVLLLGRGEQGMWPAPCYPAEIPESCRARDELCYANRSGASYSFVHVRTEYYSFRFRRENTWTAASEPAVRQLFGSVGWDRLRLVSSSEPQRVVRAVYEIGRVWAFEGDSALLLCLSAPREDANLTLRPPAAVMTGSFLNPDTGELGAVEYDGVAGERWELPVPESSRFMLLALASRPSAAGKPAPAP